MKTVVKIIALIGIAVACNPYQNITPMQSMEKDLEYPFTVQWQEVSSGAQIAYVDEGKGTETIILVHGLGSYIPAWKRNIVELRKHFRVIALDLPGYGKSSKGPWTGGLEAYAKSVMELADSLGIDKFVMGGHSMGGQVTIVAALQYPKRIEKLILAAPAGFEEFHDGEKEWFRSIATPTLTLAVKPEQIQENVEVNFYDFPEEAEFMIKDRIAMRTAEDFEGYAYIVAESIKAMVDRPVYDYLATVEQPTLIFFGEADRLIPNRFLTKGKTETIARQGHEKMPNSTLHMVPKAGHFIQFEQPEFFNQKVIEFVK